MKVINVGQVDPDPYKAAARYRAQGIEATVVVSRFQSRPDEHTLCIGGAMPPTISLPQAHGFKIGDIVRLNESGLRVCLGLTTKVEIDAQVRGVKLLEIIDDPTNNPGCMGVDLEPPLDKFLSLNDIEHV